MADSRKLTGHPWHVERLKKDEFDDRRDKRRCIHFIKTGTGESYCKKKVGKCIGSSHCEYYKENSEIDEYMVNKKCTRFMNRGPERSICKKSHSKCIGYLNCEYYKEKLTKNTTQIKPENKFYVIKVFNDLLYNEITNCLDKSLLKVSTNFNIEIKNVEIEDYSYLLPCIMGINGNNFFMISKSCYDDFIKNNELENLNVKFEIMDLYSTTSFLRSLSVFSKTGRELKVFKSKFLLKIREPVYWS